MRYIKFLFLITVLGICFSCTKENGIYEKNAVITLHGDIALDGCGFFVKINGKKYKPVNEDVISDFYHNNKNTHVEIEYKLLEKNAEIYCGMLNTPQKNVGTIEIISIKKK